MLMKSVEAGLVPDLVIRKGIKRLIVQRLDEFSKLSPERKSEEQSNFINALREAPIAFVPEKANEQHYTLPTEFFEYVLGSNMKYSCCYYKTENATLEAAEEAMLELYLERADLKDGQDILELGCGWGSLSLFMARRFPNSSITVVSNSPQQKALIDDRAKAEGLENLAVITADMNEFDIDKSFDRVVSVEMFEHMSNYQQLMAKIYRWLNPGGKLFVHIFNHDYFAYPYEVRDESDWMALHFFSGGNMPSRELLLHFQGELNIKQIWHVDGTHYEKTSRDWLNLLDKNKKKVMPILEAVYGKGNETKWFNRWRIFFMSCEELFAWDNGREWYVSHYLFEKPSKEALN